MPGIRPDHFFEIECRTPFADWYAASMSTPGGRWQLSLYGVPRDVLPESGTNTVSMSDEGLRFIFSGQDDGEYETDELSWDMVSRIADGSVEGVKPLGSPDYDTPADLWADAWCLPLDDAND